MRHVVVMVTTSYPRFPGDGVGSFIEPIAKGIAARGHEVHLVAPWHPALNRPKIDDGVHFHFFRYAPVAPLNVFGYATGLRADTQLRLAAWMMAPLAVASGSWKTMRVAQKRRATILHAHWVIPGGVIASLASQALPLVVSAHGSDVFVAERHPAARAAARSALRRAGWVTACSEDLRLRAINLGADHKRTETVPYGVDSARFAPSAQVRADVRRALGIGDAPLVFSAGRLVRKKGFEHLIDAAGALAADFPTLELVIAGEGDLRDELTARAAAAGSGRVRLIGFRSQDDVGRLAAAADAVVVPSVRDEAGNVDGLPNFALEALATATPVVATRAGGLPQAIEDGVTGRLVVERDAQALAGAIRDVLSHPARAREYGIAARAKVIRDFGWPRVAERFEAAYERARRV
ncbi:MAG TPA: glycosyltransferase [Vicinamibacterales bacterium]|jgi:glycosyltransferase involved in cell wall biosynthesis